MGGQRGPEGGLTLCSEGSPLSPPGGPPNGLLTSLSLRALVLRPHNSLCSPRQPTFPRSPSSGRASPSAETSIQESHSQLVPEWPGSGGSHICGGVDRPTWRPQSGQRRPDAEHASHRPETTPSTRFHHRQSSWKVAPPPPAAACCDSGAGTHREVPIRRVGAARRSPGDPEQEREPVRVEQP